MTTYSFYIQLDPEQSEAFVQALLPNKGDIFAYWDSLAQPGRYGHIPYDADDLFSHLEKWSAGGSLDFSVRDILGLSIHGWAETQLAQIMKKLGCDHKVLPSDHGLQRLLGEKGTASSINQKFGNALMTLSPKDKVALRGLKLILDNMGLAGKWMKMSSTSSYLWRQ